MLTQRPLLKLRLKRKAKSKLLPTQRLRPNSKRKRRLLQLRRQRSRLNKELLIKKSKVKKPRMLLLSRLSRRLPVRRAKHSLPRRQRRPLPPRKLLLPRPRQSLRRQLQRRLLRPLRTRLMPAKLNEVGSPPLIKASISVSHKHIMTILKHRVEFQTQVLNR